MPPIVHNHLSLYVLAWVQLSNDRPVSGMGGVHPIPWSTIMQWCDRYCVDEHQADKVYECVTYMDMHYCNLHNSKIDKEYKGAKANATKR